MKTTIKSLILLAVAVIFAACNNTQQQQAQDPHAGHDHGSHETAVESAAANNAAVSLKDDKLNAIYTHYLQLTKDLTDGNASAAKVAASAIELGAKQVEAGSALAQAAGKMSDAASLEIQRTTYSDLSNEFINLLKKTGLSSGELYIAHCPMALNDKGASWVSNSKEIRNPYYGESMLTCGSVKETLN